MNTQVIASIFYESQQQDRSNKYGRIYDLPAVKKGELPFLLEIKEEVQYIKQLGVNGPSAYLPLRISAEEIARDLMQCFSGNSFGVNPEQGPGIWLVSQEIVAGCRTLDDIRKHPEFLKEVARETERQTRYADLITKMAQDLSDTGKRQQVTRQMREAALYLGVTGRNWQMERPESMRACPLCAEMISSEAITCPKCRAIVDAEGYAAYQNRLLKAGVPVESGTPIPPPLSPVQPKSQART